jgi:hypothetical protein
MNNAARLPFDRITAGSSDADAMSVARRMHDIAALLAEAGLATQVYETSGVLDLTARMQPPGRREIEIVVDEDWYVEIRYWNLPAATPAEVSATITRALAAITPASPASPPQ